MTPNGVEFEVTEDGCLVIHHGEMVKSSARGRKGVAIILSPQVRKAWELGGINSENSECITQEVITFIVKLFYGKSLRSIAFVVGCTCMY